MSKTVFTIILLAGIVLQSFPTYAGGWTHPAGKGYFKLNQQFINSDTYIQPSGDKIPITKQSRYTTSLYGEFGLMDRFTVVGYIPFYQRITIDAKADPNTAMADWELGVRLGLLTKGATVVAIQAMAGLPTGDSDNETGVFTGDGEFNQMVLLQVGRSLWPTPGYLKAEIGFNNRESEFSDQIRYSGEAGFMAGDRLGISLWLRGAKAIGTDDEWTVNDQQYLSFGSEINFHLTANAGITAGVTKYTAARNIEDAPAWDIGLFLKL